MTYTTNLGGVALLFWDIKTCSEMKKTTNNLKKVGYFYKFCR